MYCCQLKIHCSEFYRSILVLHATGCCLLAAGCCHCWLLLVAASCCGFPQPADNSSADCHLAGVGPDAYSVRENFLVSFSTYYLYSSTTTSPRLSPVLQLSLPFPPALPRCTVVYLLCFISSLTANFVLAMSINSLFGRVDLIFHAILGFDTCQRRVAKF